MNMKEYAGEDQADRGNDIKMFYAEFGRKEARMTNWYNHEVHGGRSVLNTF